ncbi:3-hydroxyacyl-CoA dehydrogenase family protein [Cupriavidus basilensis]
MIECIPERLDIKRALFADLVQRAPRRHVSPAAVPVSRSAPSAKACPPASACSACDFMPAAHLVPLVEVVLGEGQCRGWRGRPDRLHAPLRHGSGQGEERPAGFLANRLQHALSREAFDLIDRGIASPEDVDAAVRFGFGFRFLAAGPVMQRDHAGIDVHAAAGATVYPTFNNSAVPARCLTERAADGRHGMKSGEGVYQWTPETIAAERERYDRLLRAGLDLIAPELPKINPERFSIRPRACRATPDPPTPSAI